MSRKFASLLVPCFLIFGHWETVLERLESGEMPPEDAPCRPTPAERAAVVAWIRALQDREAERDAGDPGIVLARRLSNAEFDYTIRDLTGVDIRLAREFPVDPANEAGFDNSGESLAMSPASVKGVSPGSQPLVLWRNRQHAQLHRGYEGEIGKDLEKLREALKAAEANLAPHFVESDANKA